MVPAILGSVLHCNICLPSYHNDVLVQDLTQVLGGKSGGWDEAEFGRPEMTLWLVCMRGLPCTST